MKQAPEWNREVLLNSPLFAPLHPLLAELGNSIFPSLHDCNALLDAHYPPINVQSGMPLRFVAQQQGKLPFDAQYEPRCYLNGEVQMRANNRHDLFNALVWLTFPKTKAILNARHYHALQDTSTGSAQGAREVSKGGVLRYLSTNGCSQRGAVRDANTLFDESGVIVVCSDTNLAALLRGFKWKELFWQRREQVRPQSGKQDMGFYLFGHGLYEKALQPYVGMTGQGLLLAVEKGYFNWPMERQLTHLDNLLADYLAAPEYCRSTRDLSPVPLLGVPGWAAENDDETYYDNTAYFRSGRRV